MSAFAAFTFLRPEALIFLPVLLGLWLMLRRAARAADTPRTPHIAPHLLAALTIGRAVRRRFSAPDFLIPAAALMTLAAAGPAWRAAPSPFVTETAPVVVALDLSRTMTTTDVPPSRLERAKQKIRDLIALRAGGRVGLVAYAGSAHLVMPLTEDPTVLLPFLEGLDPSIMPEPGRSASAALALAEDLLAHEETAGSVLFVTDGIDPADAAAFPDTGSGRVALVVAPDGGGDAVADWGRQADVGIVASSIDDGDVRAVQRALASSLARAAAAKGQLQDDGWMLALPAALLLLLWFRRGTTLRWGALATALAVAVPHEGRAEGLADWFWTADQQGSRLYAQRRYAEAAETFADPEWRAAALFRAGRYDEAAETLAPIRTAVAQVNRGTALARGRNYADAVAAFEAALAIDPGNAAARHNLDVTNRIIAYLNEARDQTTTEVGADSTVDDLTGDGGDQIRVDGQSALSEDAADQWMRQVETRPEDFLKSRFAVEAQEAR